MERKINEEFCKEVGIKKACCYLVNEDTEEVRFYSNLSGLYKLPAGWKNVKKFKMEPRYPDLINNPYNFSAVLNVQWYLFGEIGDVYKRTNEHTFEYNYLMTKVNAIKMSKSLGGGEMLEEYKKRLREIPFDYISEE